MASTMICGLFVAVAGAAEAQTAAEQPSQVSEIVVTGSRIARPNLDAPTPVSVVDAKAILAPLSSLFLAKMISCVFSKETASQC